MRRWLLHVLAAAAFLSLLATNHAKADADVYLTGVPDYNMLDPASAPNGYGCFGAACGMLMGYWDRHGFPDFYTGPTAAGVAPLQNTNSMVGIRSMWASQAGLDGRPLGMYGHVNDYFSQFGSPHSDPYIGLQRPEHAPDCIGDFIGLSQNKWTNMNNECDGNIDGYAFVFWETNGTKRLNYVPPPQGSKGVRDVPSGLWAWTRYRGYDADAFSQLVSFNPNCPPGQGFTFADLKAEIDAGYPVLAMLQTYLTNSRPISSMLRLNPEIHAMLIYGYLIYGSETNVYVRDGFGGGDQDRPWLPIGWLSGDPNYTLRGLIGYRPKPRVRSIERTGSEVTLCWDGPASTRYDVLTSTTTPLSWYQVERSLELSPSNFQPIGEVTTNLTATVPVAGGGDTVFYRVRLLSP